MGIRQALGASATLALLMGCSGGMSQLNPAASGGDAGLGAQSAQRQGRGAGRLDNSLLPPGVPRLPRRSVSGASFMDTRASAHPLIFVSDTPDGVVDIYPQAGKTQKLIGQITGLDQPQGLTTDAQRNLYVANTNSSTVLVYAPPYTGSPALTLDDKGAFPVDVAVSSTGLVAVTNICSAPHCAAYSASVNFYTQGSTKPCASVNDDVPYIFDLVRVYYAGFDSAGDLYVDGSDPYNEASFGIIQGGCGAQTITHIAPSPTFSFFLPGSIAVNSKNQVEIIDEYQEAIATFDKPNFDAFGSPVDVTPLTGTIQTSSFAMLGSGKALYTADAGGSGFTREYAYPAGGAAEKNLPVGGQPVGVAVTPPFLP